MYKLLKWFFSISDGPYYNGVFLVIY